MYTVQDEFVTCKKTQDSVCIFFDSTSLALNMYASKFYPKFTLKLEIKASVDNCISSFTVG